MLAYTDYPIVELGDIPHKEAKIRQIKVISNDGDKYSVIEVNNIRIEIKTGYIYSTPRRCGENERVP